MIPIYLNEIIDPITETQQDYIALLEHYKLLQSNYEGWILSMWGGGQLQIIMSAFLAIRAGNMPKK